MKQQWSLILSFIFALIVAIFAVINVELVEVDYLFGKADWPLILIILGSVLMGAIIVGAAGMFKYISLKREIRITKKENLRMKDELNKNEILLKDAEANPLIQVTEDVEIDEKIEH
jgi:lipopolysaccharide assembly protein A